MRGMRAGGLGDNPARANLIRCTIGDDGRFFGLQNDFFQRREGDILCSGHFDIVRLRLDFDFATRRYDLDTELVRKQADAIFNPGQEVLAGCDLRRLLRHDVEIRAGGQRHFFAAAHGHAAGSADGDDRCTAARAVLVGVGAFFPSFDLVDELIEFVQVGGVGVVGKALCVSEEFNLTLTPLLLPDSDPNGTRIRK